jgi:hypothetical protein
MPNVSLLGEDCLKCRGTRKGRCQLCRGSGYIGDVAQSHHPTEGMIDLALGAS